ncbi:GGDEF domain-containing protein [Paenibacillus xanthanilyticus]|uniref:Diguanylate cyclase n=1 Tax=Paenibacillus xanthanilyticus TaxID=1783531 RepID=A0ABV8JXH6_9BACL
MRDDPIVLPDKWVRIILYSFWLCAVFYAAASGLALLFTDEAKSEFFARIIAGPLAGIIGVVAIAELLCRYKREWLTSILIGASNGLAAIMIVANHEVELMVAVLLLPLLVSVFFLRQKVLLAASATGVGTYAALMAAYPPLQAEQSPAEAIALLFIFGAGTAILAGLLQRGAELARRWHIASTLNQALTQEKEQIERMLRMDGLSGLFNHRAFYEEAEKRLTAAGEAPGEFQLAVLDIDNFKSINDRYGHKVGDIVIKAVADTLRGLLGPEDMAFRYGGEEFTLLYGRPTPEADAAFVESIRQAIEELTFEEAPGLRVTVSIGVQAYAQGLNKHGLFEGGDRALYEAKRTGKNRIVRFS